MTVSTLVLREFATADYARYVELSNACYPEYGWTEAEVRHEDQSWDHARFFRTRVMAEDGREVVGAMDLNHASGAFVADTYWMEVMVFPEHRRRGVGSALYERVESIVGSRSGRILRIGVKESMTDGVRFVTKRGFTETKRDWESRLDVASFEEAPFAGAFGRIEAEGITVTTLAKELARDRNSALRQAYELHEDCRLDVPSTDPITRHDFGHFKKEIDGPSALPEAYYIAVDRDGRYVGESNLWASLEDPTFIWQGLTGVRRDARGKGIAMALKLHTVRYAKERGKREIKTWNDVRNQPMLRINEAMGFVKQPVWIAFEKVVSQGT